MSPQILEGKCYTSKCDVWSLGVTLYELKYKRLPFEANSFNELLIKIRSRRPNFPDYNDVLATILQGCLMPEEHQRLSWDQLFSLAAQLKSPGVLRENVSRRLSFTAQTRLVKRLSAEENRPYVMGLVDITNRPLTPFGY